jgi:hypothetical protein
VAVLRDPDLFQIVDSDGWRYRCFIAYCSGYLGSGGKGVVKRRDRCGVGYGWVLEWVDFRGEYGKWIIGYEEEKLVKADMSSFEIVRGR